MMEIERRQREKEEKDKLQSFVDSELQRRLAQADEADRLFDLEEAVEAVVCECRECVYVYTDGWLIGLRKHD